LGLSALVPRVMEDRPVRILLLTRFGSMGASSRVRFSQFVEPLVEDGFHVDNHPLFSDAYLDRLYGHRPRDFVDIAASYVKRARRVFQARRYDVVWIEKELFPWLPAFLECALLRSRRVVLDFDDAVFHRYDLHKNRVVRRLLGKKFDVLMRRARTVTVGNEYLADRARRAGARHVVILPSVVDLRRYVVRQKPEVDPTVTVGWIGSPATEPYIQSVLQPLEALLSATPARFVAIGARKPVLPHLGGQVAAWSQESEARLLQMLDIGIMPLPDDLWARGKCGYKLIQYMAAGLPVVASPVGVNTEIVQQGVNGFLAATPDEWLTALRTLVNDRELRRKMGADGRRRVEERYSVDAVRGRLAEVLRKAARE
jgi:glycosyltransferase involved in cell wall biosynthesis